MPKLAGDAEVREALEKAFDYRGDITITRKDGSKVEGYLFDRRSGASLTDSFVRIIPQHREDQGQRGLCRHRRDRLHRTRYCRRQNL